MIRKAIFGGTFDPIHYGHLHIAYTALEELNLDSVIFMPAGIPPHKAENNITDANIRYEMVKIAIRNESRFEVSDYEIKSEGRNYTYKTLEYYNNMYKNIEWYFLTGLDCLMELNSWKNVNDIFKLCTLVVLSRSGYSKQEILAMKNSVEKNFNTNIILLETELMDISSSKIRDKVQNDKNISYLVPPEVCSMIYSLRLYNM